MLSDIILRFISCALAIFLGLLAVTASDVKSASGVGAFALLNSAIAIGAHRRLKALRAERATFLSRFEGKPFEDAVAMARVDGIVLPPGLVAEKVRGGYKRWTAFERQAFQFVIAADEHGHAHAYAI